MNIITRYLILAFVMLFTLQSNAQIFGIKGGFNYNNALYKEGEINLNDVFDMSLKGFHIGGTMENSLTDVLSLESGLMVSLKGFKLDELQAGVTVRNKTDLYYLDIPISLKATFNMGYNSKWYLSAGPVFDIGMIGNYITIYDWSGSKQVQKEKIKWGNVEDGIKRFDMGLTFGAGMEFRALLVGIYYDLGLTNVSPDANPNETIKNRLWKISVGYRFGDD